MGIGPTRGWLCVTGALVLALAACKKDRSSGDGAEKASASAKFLPEGSRGMAVLRVDKLLSSPLFGTEPFRSQIAAAKSDGDFKVLIDAGIDPFSNVDVAMLAGDPETHKLVAVVSGSFDAEKAAEALNAAVRNFSAIEDRHKRTAAAVANGTVILGTREAVESAKAGKGIGGSPELEKLVARLDKSKTMYGTIAVPPSMLRGAPDPNLQNLKGVTVSAGVGDGVDLEAAGLFDSEETATALKQTAERFLPMAKGRVPDAFLDAISLRTSGPQVQVSLSLPADALGGDNAELIEDGVRELRDLFEAIIKWLTLT